LSFVRLSRGKLTVKLAINWQNFAQVRLQLKFTFRIIPLSFTPQTSTRTTLLNITMSQVARFIKFCIFIRTRGSFLLRTN